MNYLWLAVTADKYELPLVVCTSAVELANKLGATHAAVVGMYYKGLSGERVGYRVVRIEN